MSEQEKNKTSDVAKREEGILAFWQENDIFRKSLEKPSKGNYVFYDGPPFATGLPHYGHILASAIKDAVPRYRTMRGFYVERKWGWDCHGLPIENIVEKDLKISGRRQIEEYGVDKFNEYARSKVLDFVDHWRDTVGRIGRWVDFDGSYKTMDNTYIESVWWALKQMSEKGLVYEGNRVLPYCPRCETPISNSEIAMDNSYKDISDISVYAKFELEDEPGTFVVAWTTTPWTLPANTALAVNADADYVKVKASEENGAQGTYIVAKDLRGKLDKVLKEASVASELKGSELVGKRYKPLFDYYAKDGKLKDRDNGWKIYAAGFVMLTEGTGIVHMAPGYGEEDNALAKELKFPMVLHVDHEGKFKPEVADFAGRPVKPKAAQGEKDGHQVTDIEIVKHLARAGLLLHKERIVHSYPHCHRCETPLYYTALPAWFVRIQDVKKRLVELNGGINWIPDHLKRGRFEKSMEGAPDWNISRNRFWASPLPIWKCDKCGEVEFVGSLAELQGKVGRGNRFLAFRHGEAENNERSIMSSDDAVATASLTSLGRESVRKNAEALKGTKFDMIYASPLARTKETAEIVAEAVGFPKERIAYDDRLKELGFGVYNGKPAAEYHGHFDGPRDKFGKAPEGGETYYDVKRRVGSFLYELNAANEGKTILVVSHEAPIWMMFAVAHGKDLDGTLGLHDGMNHFIENAQALELDFAPMPHNANYELDMHRPYIDGFAWKCRCGGEKRRIPEVIDCWFESGSMPFAQKHYPFENKEWFEGNFPSQFVAEYIAQTRTWFYYMHAVSTMLFDSRPFDNVVTTGTVLAEDGQKMSKSKGNFPDPRKIFDTYGVDALRFYLLSSPIMRSEDLNFSEKGVDEVYKKIILRLGNVLSFYELYRDPSAAPGTASGSVLDRWILSRLSELVAQVTEAMEAYEIDRALRPVDLFIDDLSTWYLRRSRERLKGDDAADKQSALSTFRLVLIELSKVMAPFTPFIAERVYQAAKPATGRESVHLEDWPEAPAADPGLISDMAEIRRIVSLGLEARAKANIKVRQPLSSLKVKKMGVAPEREATLLALIADEVNVKSVESAAGIEADVELDTELTPELREEGVVREFIRSVQDMRKKAGLNPSDTIELRVQADEEGKRMLTARFDEVKKTVLARDLAFIEALDGADIDAGGVAFRAAF